MKLIRLLVLTAGAATAVFPANVQVALLDSANTRDFFARHYPTCGAGSFYLGAEEYQRYFRGWEYVLQTNGIPYELINDFDVTETGLSRFKLLILSNNAELTSDQSKAVQQWVIRGGRLIATFGSGYKSTDEDSRQVDNLKLQKGGTVGLHELWHDPMSKLFSSNTVNNGAGTDILITQYTGPTACLSGQLTGDLLPYGAESNLLVQRPLDAKDVLGAVMIKNVSFPRPEPGIISTRLAAGLVVYYAFAPEYIVSKEFNLPTSIPCPDGQNWSGRSAAGRALMLCTIQYLLAN